MSERGGEREGQGRGGGGVGTERERERGREGGRQVGLGRRREEHTRANTM